MESEGDGMRNDDLQFMRLWDLYSPMLTANQREITDLYFNFDLSLGEIAEQKGVSRQSVSDCLQKCRKQLEKYEEKLGFAKALDETAREYSAFMTATGRWIKQMRESRPDCKAELDGLQTALEEVLKAHGAEITETQDGAIVGTAFRLEK